MTSRPRRVCIGLIETAGVAAGLADGFAELGWRPTVVLTHRHPFGYAQPHARLRLLTAAIRWLSSQTPRPLRTLGRAVSIPLRIVVLVICAARNDVFVFVSRSRFVTYRELALLRRLGKEVVHVFLGSDVRPPYMDGNLMRPSWGRSIDDCRMMLSETVAAISAIERWSSLIVSHPPYAQLQRRPCAHILAVGLPIRHEVGRREWSARPVPGDRRAVVVLHSPSSPEVKGTALIRAAVQRLLDEGIDLEYREISGVENDQVLAAITEADVVVDQCYSDTPLAMFATEAAAVGRAVIVGGYAWNEIDRLVPAELVPPSIRCHPDELYETLRHVVQDEALRHRCAHDLHEFVGRLAAPEVVGRLIALLDGSAPSAWWFDPADVRYEEGCGLDARRAHQLRAEVVR